VALPRFGGSERGLKDIGGSRTLVSNWWLVNSFLGPKKLVAPEN
jgi:hypothetical protein